MSGLNHSFLVNTKQLRASEDIATSGNVPPSVEMPSMPEDEEQTRAAHDRGPCLACGTAASVSAAVETNSHQHDVGDAVSVRERFTTYTLMTVLWPVRGVGPRGTLKGRQASAHKVCSKGPFSKDAQGGREMHSSSKVTTDRPHQSKTGRDRSGPPRAAVYAGAIF